MKRLAAMMATFLLPVGAWADAPSILNFTGTLMDTTGQPLVDASYNVTFRIMSGLTGGTQLWQEVVQVNTEDGVF